MEELTVNDLIVLLAAVDTMVDTGQNYVASREANEQDEDALKDLKNIQKKLSILLDKKTSEILDNPTLIREMLNYHERH